MGGASTLTYNERFLIAMSNVKREFDEVSGFCDYFSARVKDLEAENAKLRELATRFADYVGQDRCEGCVTKTRCNEGLIDECWLLTEIREIADGLGIEVER